MALLDVVGLLHSYNTSDVHFVTGGAIWNSYNPNYTRLYGPRGSLMMQMLAENVWAKPGEFKHLVAKLSTAIQHDSWGSLEEASTGV